MIVLLHVYLLLLLNAKNITYTNAFQSIFQTDETIRENKSREIHKYINLSADPCNDFFEYACGNFKSLQPLIPKKQIEAQIDVDLIRLLNEYLPLDDSPFVRQCKEFYKSCIEAQQHQTQQQQIFLSDFIKQNGGFPAVPGSNWVVQYQNYNWIKVIGNLRRHYNMDILIGLRITYNYANVHENTIYLVEPETLISSELCNKVRVQNLSPQSNNLKSIINMVARKLQVWIALENDDSTRVAESIVNFEIELCKSMNDEKPWDSEQFLHQPNLTRKTLAELTRIYENKLNFNDYFNVSFGQQIFKPVYMATPDYYSQLIQTINIYDMSCVANYIMYRALDMLTFPVDDQQQTRASYCLNNIKKYWPKALGELYSQHYTRGNVKEQVLQMYVHLQNSFKISLQSDWIKEETRRVGESKLSEISLHFPTYDRTKGYNINIDRTNYWNNLRQLLGHLQMQECNRLFEDNLPQPRNIVQSFEMRVEYRAVQRRIEIGWALLLPPNYDSRFGHALFYATVGQTIAEQLALAFNDIHWSVALLGSSSWDRTTAKNYQSLTACFSMHVSEYLRHNTSGIHHLISKSAGLSIAFRAYLSWLEFQEPHNEFQRLAKETLPGLNYSNTVLFFLVFAQQHCFWESGQESTQQGIYSLYQTQTRSKQMVNEPLRNHKEFAREFHCSMGTFMNPADKCVIY